MSAGSGKTETVAGPFEDRSEAEALERELQRTLDAGARRSARPEAIDVVLPDWAKGVRVERIGNKKAKQDKWAVVATEDKR
jgi:hypothetical protein